MCVSLCVCRSVWVHVTSRCFPCAQTKSWAALFMSSLLSSIFPPCSRDMLSSSKQTSDKKGGHYWKSILSTPVLVTEVFMHNSFSTLKWRIWASLQKIHVYLNTTMREVNLAGLTWTPNKTSWLCYTSQTDSPSWLLVTSTSGHTVEERETNIYSISSVQKWHNVSNEMEIKVNLF